MILFPPTQISTFDWLTSQKVIDVYKMICDWLANRESSIKIDVFRVRWEKRSYVHTKDQRIRKEMFPRTKASPAKASLSEKLNKIEKLHQLITSVVCLSNTTKARISFYKKYCVGIMVKVFANSPRDLGSILGRVIPKTQKWYLMLPCLTLSIMR